jgi:hypothetical protein
MKKIIKLGIIKYRGIYFKIILYQIVKSFKIFIQFKLCKIYISMIIFKTIKIIYKQKKLKYDNLLMTLIWWTTNCIRNIKYKHNN